MDKVFYRQYQMTMSLDGGERNFSLNANGINIKINIHSESFSSAASGQEMYLFYISNGRSSI